MENGKIKVAAVSYLNTKPLLYGLQHLPVHYEIKLSLDYPSKIGKQLIDNEVDIGLIPVALIPKLSEYHIISNYCIGAIGPVASVCMFSEVPIEEITCVYLDSQSKSSVALARFLLKNYWKIRPVFLRAEPGYENNIKDSVAGVIIGDRALKKRQECKYVYDLADAWVKHTGLPMVFAAWISNKELPKDFIERFNKATGYGTSGDALQ
ncbi:MAG: menaquinone biosynthetic enzyme MqnA/MqnD family protein, partial [Chitinophagaceae bacterium]